MHKIQWYPGHIAKTERELDKLLKVVDVVIEVVDARLPVSTVNARLRKRFKAASGEWHKPVVVLLNKADLADKIQNERWLRAMKQQVPAAFLYESLKQGQAKQNVVQAVLKLAEPKMKALEAKGMKRRAARVLVTGMPNVGKSSVINNLVGRKKTQTGHKAGVTRQPQWVRIHPQIELLDIPGVIPPSLESEESGMLLACVSSVGEAAFDEEEVAKFLLGQIAPLYPGLLQAHYKLGVEEPVDLEAVARCRHYVKSGDAIDTLRAAQAVLSDFRQGRFGRLTLEPYEGSSVTHADKT